MRTSRRAGGVTTVSITASKDEIQIGMIFQLLRFVRVCVCVFFFHNHPLYVFMLVRHYSYHVFYLYVYMSV